MAQKRVPQPKRRTYKPTYLRAWREHRGLTQEALAARIEGMFDEETTSATISGSRTASSLMDKRF